MSLLRRRMMMQTEGDEDMKEWNNIVSEAKAISGETTVEFDLTTGNTLYDEFVVDLHISKHGGENECAGKLDMYLNGNSIGYYIFNQNYKSNDLYAYLEASKKPFPHIKIAALSNSLTHNASNIRYQRSFSISSKDPSKFIMTFPAEYTGTISVEIYAR